VRRRDIEFLKEPAAVLGNAVPLKEYSLVHVGQGECPPLFSKRGLINDNYRARNFDPDCFLLARPTGAATCDID
jgi:hypothetical protein